MTLLAPGTDRYGATVAPDAEGRWTFRVEGWSDVYATWEHAALIKIAAGLDVELMLEEGARVLERAQEVPGIGAGDVEILATPCTALRDRALAPGSGSRPGPAPAVHAVLARHPLRDLVTSSPTYPLVVQRERALFSAWYEMFPRSEGAHVDPETGRWVSGTFRTATRRLPAIAAMGFDIVYLPPIHPIGRVDRKGPNNTLDPGPDDPGVPWAIGSDRGRARRRSTPTSARSRTSTTSWRQRARPGPGGRARPRPAVRAGPPVGPPAPRVVHHARRRLDRLRREPAQEVPGHLPA